MLRPKHYSNKRLEGDLLEFLTVIEEYAKNIYSLRYYDVLGEKSECSLIVMEL
jgi:hypothetical protein